MTSVVDWFSQSPKQLAATIGRLQASNARPLIRIGNTLESQDEETRSNLFDSVLRHIDIWGSPQLEPVVSSSTILFDELRRKNVTLYICVTPEELVSYRSIIRCLLGQILYAFRDRKEDWDLPPVTFFIDEFPQLGYMPEIEQMLALGRQAGLRLWLFAQTKGQIESAYNDATRLLDMMAVRCFIEPTGQLAEAISKELGLVRDIYEGTEKPLASPQELSGPAYAGKVIVFEGGHSPARLIAVKAFEDATAKDRMNLSPPDDE